VNKFEHTGSTCHQAGPQALHMQVYSGLSPKKLFKKPNLGESQMKAVFSGNSAAVVFINQLRHITSARKEIVSTNFGHILHTLTVFRYAMLKIQIARSQNLLPKFWHTSYVLPKAAQNMYAPFTKNRREIVTIQKNDRLGFISFEKAFSVSRCYRLTCVRACEQATDRRAHR
jgi:hypothetical protein